MLSWKKFLHSSTYDCLVFKIWRIFTDFRDENFKNFQGFPPDPLDFVRAFGARLAILLPPLAPPPPLTFTLKLKLSRDFRFDGQFLFFYIPHYLMVSWSARWYFAEWISRIFGLLIWCKNGRNSFNALSLSLSSILWFFNYQVYPTRFFLSRKFNCCRTRGPMTSPKGDKINKHDGDDRRNCWKTPLKVTMWVWPLQILPPKNYHRDTSKETMVNCAFSRKICLIIEQISLWKVSENTMAKCRILKALKVTIFPIFFPSHP